MNLWKRVKCSWFGKCAVPPDPDSQSLIARMRANVSETVRIKDDIKRIRETGQWPKRPLYPLESTIFPEERAEQ